MSKQIKTALENTEANLEQIETNLVNSKEDIYNALVYCGIGTYVSTEDTFSEQASFVKNFLTLRDKIPFTMEITIPTDGDLSDYKRTVVLPMYFGEDGNDGYSLNDIADEVINGTSDDTSEDATTKSEWEEDNASTYSYYVDWGDETGYFYYDYTKSYAANKGAIWHTYSKGATYDISIYGTYKTVYCSPNISDMIYRTTDDNYMFDTDGVIVYDNDNYGLRNYLVEIMSWGRTDFINLENAFAGCENLETVPKYDAIGAFTDVENCAYMFCNCTSLTSFPYNTDTDRGLFTGCENITSFEGCFMGCTGITDSINENFCSGCSNVTTVKNMFKNCSNLTGSLPYGMFSEMPNLVNASGTFYNCVNLSGDIDKDIFANSTNVEDISYMFYNCQNITGKLYHRTIGELSSLTNMELAFYNCTNFEGFEIADNDGTINDTFPSNPDNYDEFESDNSYAFFNLTSDNLNCRRAFYGCTSITEIPDGLIESLTGLNIHLENMFEDCTGITSLSLTSLENLHVSNARGMFAGCTNLASALPNENSDWDSATGISRWLGAFANTSLSDIDDVCLELGGDGDRKYSDYHVGAIVMTDGTLYDPKDFYSVANMGGAVRPIGVVYADVVISPDSEVSTLEDGSGNIQEEEAGLSHTLFCTVLNETNGAWTYQQWNSEDITTITNTTDTSVAYNSFTWSTDDDGNYTATIPTARYNGQAYTDALIEWQVDNGYVEDVSDFDDMNTTNYQAVNYCYTYNDDDLAGGYYDTYQFVNGVCFLPDGADVWDQICIRHLIQKACDEIIYVRGQGDYQEAYTEDTCYPMSNKRNYWTSAESDTKNVWIYKADDAKITSDSIDNNYKWNNLFIRPSFKLSVLTEKITE